MTKTDELKGRIICQGWYYLNGIKTCPHSPCINTGGYECGMDLTDNFMKTDELISKLEEAIEQYNKHIASTNPEYINILSAWNELKEQIKKEENINDFTIPYLKSEYNQQLERITKIIGKKPDVFEQGINALLYIIENKVNPDIMPDTCCGKYKEVIGFDVIDRHNKKCFNDTLKNIKKSIKEDKSIHICNVCTKSANCTKIDSEKVTCNTFQLKSPYLKETGEEQSLKDENAILTEILSKKSRKNYDAIILNNPKESPAEQPLKSAEEILDKYGCPEIPFDENITMFYPAIINAMKEYASQPTKDTTDEEIQDEAWVQSGLNGWSYNERTRWIEGMKRMRDKMKSNGKI